MKVKYQPSPKAERPTFEKGIDVKYAKAKRGGFRGRWYMLLLLVTAPVILMLWLLTRPYLFVLAPGIVTTEPLEVRAPQRGMISEILVSQGMYVQENEPLLILEDTLLDAQITELKRQRAKLDVSLDDEQQEILRQLQQRIDVAKDGLNRQEKLLRNFQDFERRGLIPVSDTVAIIQYHTAAKMALEQAKTDNLKEHYDQLVEQQSGTIAQLRQSIDLELVKLYSLKSALQIQAPFNAKVADIQVQAGEVVGQELTLMWLSGRDNPVVIAYLEPKHLKFVAIGQNASVKLPTGDTFRAQINEPTELVGKLPKYLSGPFDGEKPVLKVTLTPKKSLSTSIEGIPVEVSFDHVWPWLDMFN